MTINKTQNGLELVIALEGRLDANSSTELEATINGSLSGIQLLVFDFAELTYISSAGLRVLLAAQRVMNKQGSMVVRNVSEEVIKIFEVTGFDDILTVE